MDPNMADLDQAIPQWVFQRAKARATPRCFRCAQRGSMRSLALARLRSPLTRHACGAQGVAFMWVYKARGTAARRARLRRRHTQALRCNRWP
jgi:hypothetical protein